LPAVNERDLLARLIHGPVNGDALARMSGQTRAAVWKRIDGLREAGVPITARPGQGYALAQPMELLDVGAIRPALPPEVASGLATLEVAWTLDSTNSELLRRPAPPVGAEVLLAERQTGGRGRRGRECLHAIARRSVSTRCAPHLRARLTTVVGKRGRNRVLRRGCRRRRRRYACGIVWLQASSAPT
jgi:biotin operon repressor BirA-like protein